MSDDKVNIRDPKTGKQPCVVDDDKIDFIDEPYDWYLPLDDGGDEAVMGQEDGVERIRRIQDADSGKSLRDNGEGYDVIEDDDNPNTKWLVVVKSE